METLFIAVNADTDAQSGTVFFSDDWDAYGWQTDNFTNGPFDDVEEACAALQAETKATVVFIAA